ncbi:MAG: signal transduction protein, partial [Deltaproteobacteria bacterium]
MNVFVARQPLFTLEKKIFAYELLFRLGTNNSFPDVDQDEATSSLLSNIFSPFDFNEILGGKPGFINFTKKLILQKIPLLLPREHFVIEVLEDIEPEINIISALSQFKKKGFTIVLDDFVYHKKYDPMMALSSIIKFDIKATPLETLSEILKEIKSNYDITFLAEKVETYGEFELAKEMGFSLFQGYFFSKPEILSKKGISSNQMTKLKLINELSCQELNLIEIEALIKNDVAISFKLLKFINSAYFNRLNPIDTIKDAITYLGVDELKKFIRVIALSELSSNKPDELIRLSVVRARMCEQFGSIVKTNYTIDELFTLGLFSFMDALLDRKMEDILKNITFSEKKTTALLGNDKE